MTGVNEGLKELYDHDPVEMSPEDAEKIGVSDGDWVWVISRRGKN